MSWLQHSQRSDRLDRVFGTCGPEIHQRQVTHFTLRYHRRGTTTLGCSTCVDRPTDAVATGTDDELRPSLRKHQTPDTAAAVTAAALVAEPVRAGILAILRDGPHCVCEMAAALDVKQNNLSNHLAKLREAGLVRASRSKVDARWKYYERDEDAVTAAGEALARVF